jgi:septum formation protein
LGLRVRVVPSGVEEGERPGWTPLQVAEYYARAKAEAVAARERDAFVVGADTVVDLDGAALGKPSGPGQAAAMLRALAGREHVVHTAFAVVDAAGRARHAEAHSTRVRFAPLGAGVIARYVAGGDPLDKAGAYGIQGRGAALIERIDGDYYTVMGFPLGAFVRALPLLGYALPTRPEAVPT